MPKHGRLVMVVSAQHVMLAAWLGLGGARPGDPAEQVPPTKVSAPSALPSSASQSPAPPSDSPAASAAAAIAAQAEAAAAAADPTSARVFPPESLLPNFLRSDPTAELTELVQLSPEQAQHIARTYAEYVETCMALGRRVQERVDREGLWAKYKALGKDAPPEAVRAGRLSMNRAVEAAQREYLVAEQAMLDAMAAAIPQVQAARFRQASLTIMRRSWLDPGPMKRQDFFQFGDPLAPLLARRNVLEDSPEALAAIDQLILQSQEDLAVALPAVWCEYRGARRAAMLADAAGDAEDAKAALRKRVKAWKVVYDRLDGVMEAGANALAEAGRPDAARACREDFWRQCFPDLVGYELTPAVLNEVSLKGDQLDPDRREALKQMCEQYFNQRFQLLQRAVNQHISDFMTMTDPEERFELLAGDSLGSSSIPVAEAQLDRCRLSLKTRAALAELYGPLPPLMDGPGVRQVKQDANRAGWMAFDTPEAEAVLGEQLAALHRRDPVKKN